jgi:hypothetical protein
MDPDGSDLAGAADRATADRAHDAWGADADTLHA